MGVLDKFEKGVERAFSTTFARAFRADLKPVDIASALRVEMDDRTAALSRGRTVVPNAFVVELSSSDIEKVGEWGEGQLIDDLITAATSHATDQGYVFVGPVEVHLEEVDGLKAGQFRVRSSSSQIGANAGAHAPAALPHDQHSGGREDRWEGTPPSPPPPDPSAPRSLPAQPMLDVDGQRYLLTGEVTVVGRGAEADIIVSDTGVSRQHVQFRIASEGVIVSDLGSTNGVYVEGHKVDAATLVDGNTLTIGRTRIIYWAATHHPTPGGAA